MSTDIPGKQRLAAVAIALLGILTMVQNPSLASALIMCGFFLMAWRDFFYLQPSARLRMQKIYDGYRDGKFGSDRIGRLASLASVVLMIAGFAMKWAGHD